ncbi:MAG: NADH-quinone oxidoreductase subunit N [Nitrososphaerota archaeon]|nr:NADH-quinone oxidoreductase subunit N [Nitrososphaerota archaeon]MDG6937812.1 NADH-quinone oxidoreductase subunit N [Nitrososphaerota archaeon]MDG6952982.1 NADH-quinone oxidoreductase subunit N [Nitrososphaerota archaeon]MDG6959601.1 NADH-quinone oxidoreductase subunit N [Nitrososphaerota archaeon]MDG6965280.1 NADH-quinone oxidoreductase subunit N [Nitrososphaerota archaeon]
MDYILAAVVILSAAALGTPILQLFGWRVKLEAYLSIAAIAASIALIAANTAFGVTSAGFGALLVSDPLGDLFALVVLSVTLAVAVASIYTSPSGPSLPSYYSLLMFSALGMLILSYSADLLMLFVAWELMSLPTYALAGFDKKRVQSNEAAAKYAILGALSSAIILYAMSLTYGVAGTTQISGVVAKLASEPFNPLVSVAILLFVVGFGFKMSIVPFHMWVPDAYEGSPPAIATLFATATKKAGFVAAIRVVLAVATVYALAPNSAFTLANVLAVLAVITMTLGNVAALTQKTMTRLLAYSSIAQAGYILVGFAIFAYSQQTGLYSYNAMLGMTGSLFHIINHAIMKGAAFLAATLVILQLKRGDLGVYSGLAKRMPVTAFTIAISFLALGGIPPLNGFWSKLLIFVSVINTPLAWVAVAAILNSAFSLGYYFWVIKRMYLDSGESTERVHEPLGFVVIFAILVGLMIGIGLFPQQFISFASSAASGLFP